MGLYFEIKEQMRRRGDCAFEDLFQRNPANWRDQLPQTAPAGAADAEYDELEARVAELIAGLDECEREWAALEGRAMAAPSAAAVAIAAKMAKGQPFSRRELQSDAYDYDAEAMQLVTRAKAIVSALDQVTRRMQQLAKERGGEWQARTAAQWEADQQEARRLEAQYKRAMATASAAHVAHVWTQRLPQSITGAAYEPGDMTPFDRPWQDQ